MSQRARRIGVSTWTSELESFDANTARDHNISYHSILFAYATATAPCDFVVGPLAPRFDENVGELARLVLQVSNFLGCVPKASGSIDVDEKT